MAAERPPLPPERWYSVVPGGITTESARAIAKIAEMTTERRNLASPLHAAAWPLAQFFMIAGEEVPRIGIPTDPKMPKWYWYIERDLLARFMKLHLEHEVRPGRLADERAALLATAGDPGIAIAIRSMRMHDEDRQTFFGIVASNASMAPAAAFDATKFADLARQKKLNPFAAPIIYVRADILAALSHALKTANSMELVASPFYAQKTSKYWGVTRDVPGVVRVPESVMDALAGKLLTHAVVCEGLSPCFAATMQQCWLDAAQGERLLAPGHKELARYLADFDSSKDAYRKNLKAMVGTTSDPWDNALDSRAKDPEKKKRMLGLTDDSALGCIIREHAGESIAVYLRRNTSTLYGSVRSLLYQAAHALYCAYRRLGFVHGHVDVSNARVKYLPDYADKDWLFRTPQGWVKIPREDHCGMLLKFSDFGDSVVGDPRMADIETACASVGYGMLEDDFGGLKKSAEIIYDFGMFCWMITCCLGAETQEMTKGVRKPGNKNKNDKDSVVRRMIDERTIYHLGECGISNYAALSLEDLHREYVEGLLDPDFWPLKRVPPVKIVDAEIDSYLDACKKGQWSVLYLVAKSYFVEPENPDEMPVGSKRKEVRRIATAADAELKYLGEHLEDGDVQKYVEFVDRYLLDVSQHIRVSDENQPDLYKRIVADPKTSLPIILDLRNIDVATIDQTEVAWGGVRGLVNSPDASVRADARNILRAAAMALYGYQTYTDKKVIDQIRVDEMDAYLRRHWIARSLPIRDLPEVDVFEWGQKYVLKMKSLEGRIAPADRAALFDFNVYPKELRRGMLRELIRKSERFAESFDGLTRDEALGFVRKTLARSDEFDVQMLKLRILADAKKASALAASDAEDAEIARITGGEAVAGAVRRRRADAEASAKAYLCNAVETCCTALANADVERLFQLMETAATSERVKSIMFGETEHHTTKRLRRKYRDEMREVVWHTRRGSELEGLVKTDARDKMKKDVEAALETLKKESQSRTTLLYGVEYSKEPGFMRAFASTAVDLPECRDAIVDVLSRKFYARHTKYHAKTSVTLKPTATAPMKRGEPRTADLTTYEEKKKKAKTKKPTAKEKEIDVGQTMLDFVQVHEDEDEHLFREYKLRDISSNSMYLSADCVAMSTRAVVESSPPEKKKKQAAGGPPPPEKQQSVVKSSLPDNLDGFVRKKGAVHLCTLCGRKRPQNWSSYYARIARPDLFLMKVPNPAEDRIVEVVACHRICKMILEGKIDVASPLGIATTQFPYLLSVDIPKPPGGRSTAICDNVDAISKASEALAEMPAAAILNLLRSPIPGELVSAQAKLLLNLDEELTHAPTVTSIRDLAILDAFAGREILETLALGADVGGDVLFRAACIRARKKTEDDENNDLGKIYNHIGDHIINFVKPIFLMQLLGSPRAVDIVARALLARKRTNSISTHPLADRLRDEMRRQSAGEFAELADAIFIKPFARMIALADPKLALYNILGPRFDYAGNSGKFADDQLLDDDEYFRAGIAMTLACRVDTATLSVLRAKMELSEEVDAALADTTVAKLKPDLLQKVEEVLRTSGVECLDLAVAMSPVCFRLENRVGDANSIGVRDAHARLYLGCMMPSTGLELLESLARDPDGPAEYLQQVEWLAWDSVYSQIVTSEMERYLTEESTVLAAETLGVAKNISGHAESIPAQIQGYPGPEAKCEEWLAGLIGTRCVPSTLLAICDSDDIVDSLMQPAASAQEDRRAMDTNAFVFAARVPASAMTNLRNLDRVGFKRVVGRAAEISDELVAKPASPPPSPPPHPPSPGPFTPPSPGPMPPVSPSPPPLSPMLDEPPEVPVPPEGDRERRGPVSVALKRYWLRRGHKKPIAFDPAAENARRAAELRRRYGVRTAGGTVLRYTERRAEVRKAAPGRKSTTVLVRRRRVAEPEAAAASTSLSTAPPEKKKKETKEPPAKKSKK